MTDKLKVRTRLIIKAFGGEWGEEEGNRCFHVRHCLLKKSVTIQVCSLMDSVREGEGGKIWENDIETCKISCMKRVASPGSMHDTG